MNSARLLVLTLACVLALSGPAVGDPRGAPASFSAVADDSQPLYWQVDPDGDGPIQEGDPVHRSSAAIWRDQDGVSFRVRTTGLDKGHGYTVWFFSYDNPDACTGGDGDPGTRCTVMDLFNPAALASLMWGRSGKFVTGSGLTTFTGRRPANVTPCVTEPVVVDDDCSGVLLGQGLRNPLGAEVHFVLRDHGPDQDGVDDEITTINGGCDPLTHHGLPVFGPGWGTPGDYPCFDPQGNNSVRGG